MEVILKKTKITKSIFEQIRSLHSSIDYSFLKSIGWCTYKGSNFFIFSDSNGLLVKCPSIYEITKYKNFQQIDSHGNREEHYFVKIRPNGNFYDYDFGFKTDESAQIKLYENFVRLKKESLDLGQFFI